LSLSQPGTGQETGADHHEERDQMKFDVAMDATSMSNYNQQRPHLSLHGMTPVERRQACFRQLQM
jgi:hypothetical protein